MPADMDDPVHINIFRFLVNDIDVTKKNIEQCDKGGKTVQVPCIQLGPTLKDKRIINDNDDADTQQSSWSKYLQQIIFERLLIEDYNSYPIVDLNLPEKHTCNPTDSPKDPQILRYLYGCFFRCQMAKQTESDNTILQSIQTAENLIVDQVALYLTEPDLFPDRDKRVKNNQQAPLLLNLVKSNLIQSDPTHGEVTKKFVNSISETCSKMGDASCMAVIEPTYIRLSQKFVSLTVDDPDLLAWFEIIEIFLEHPQFAKLFIQKITPQNDSSLAYQSSLLGYVLSITHLPRTSQIDLSFFQSDPRSNADLNKSIEDMLGLKLTKIGQELHKIFLMLLKTNVTRPLILSWLGRCLNTFKDRKKLWNNQIIMSTTTISVNDGFLMNLFTTMLYLSEPFAGNSEPCSKMLRIDPRYCKWSKATRANCAVHFLGLAEETMLVSPNKSSNVDTARSASSSSVDQAAASCSDNQQADERVAPNFITECFYGTHQAFSYGFRSVYERFSKLTQAVNELHHAIIEASEHGPVPSDMPDPRDMLLERYQKTLGQFLNLKTILMVPGRVEMQIRFCISTAAYVNHLIACESLAEAMEAKQFKQITKESLNGKKLKNTCLRHMPEMVIENILDFFLFLCIFNDRALSQWANQLDPLMTMMVTFMRDSSLMQNPHLRARFAELLEYLMPHQSHHGNAMVGCPQLFEQHPLAEALAPALVNVFVSIEMTGEGVQFEQKFSYRRPMYIVLEYLWRVDLHRQVLIDLAKLAELNIESSRPPLFLRFINLLMNDAIFLLDEALSYMNQLREGERKKKSPEWQRMTQNQRVQAHANLTHVGRLARFHNVLGLSTIGTLAWLTKDIKTIFSHSTLVARIANMLNYFLQHLVGPKRHQFNVEDKNDYEFKPREVLQKICQIYVHLGDKSNPNYEDFCTAITNDGRSYSQSLFPSTISILQRTGQISLATEFEELSQLVESIAAKNKLDEINTEDIPDAYLDPIMSTVMRDPVLLPSSKIIVDRSTIARHLLSDQTDPFNRSALSMEDVIAQTELKQQIQEFISQAKKSA